METMTRVLGRSGIPVSALGFGGWAMGGPAWAGEMPLSYGPVDEREAIRAVHCALDQGITFFDTADVYGAGRSEEVLGRALAGRRARAVICTKFGFSFDETTRRVGESIASPEYIRQACERSLRRLGTDTIDLYLFHLYGHPRQEAEAVLDTLEGLARAGKIRAHGWSTDDPARARDFAQGPHCAAVEFRMNVLEDKPEMVGVCHTLNLAGINNSPLAMGLLSGKYGPESLLDDDEVRGRRGPGWVTYFKDGRPSRAWLGKVEALRDILTSGGRTPAQGALGWLWARSPMMIPIPGMRTAAQVEENARAMQLGPLSLAQLEAIERILARKEKKRPAAYQALRRKIWALTGH